MRSRELFPQPHGELEPQALRNKEPPQPRGPSLLTLQALQELDLTACSKLSDASLAKVGLGCGQAGAPGGESQGPVGLESSSHWLLLPVTTPLAGGGEPGRSPAPDLHAVPHDASSSQPTSLQVLQLPQLRRLSLSLLPALTDKGLVAMARGCPSLERLALSHCSLLSDEGWAQAAGFWPRLQHLNLSSCSQLTEQ